MNELPVRWPFSDSLTEIIHPARSVTRDECASVRRHRCAGYDAFAVEGTDRRARFQARDPETSAGRMVPAFAAALSVRINDALRVMAP